MIETPIRTEGSGVDTTPPAATKPGVVGAVISHLRWVFRRRSVPLTILDILEPAPERRPVDSRERVPA